MPLLFGLDGIWYSFPISDILATTVTLLYLQNALKKSRKENFNEEIIAESKAIEVA